jgi:hypothetical protein
VIAVLLTTPTASRRVAMRGTSDAAMCIRSLTTLLAFTSGLACTPRVIDVSDPSTTVAGPDTGDATTTDEPTTGEPCDPQGHDPEPGSEPCKPGFECRKVPGNSDVFVCQKPKP